jgi:hypothetical protein
VTKKENDDRAKHVPSEAEVTPNTQEGDLSIYPKLGAVCGFAGDIPNRRST